VAELTKRDKLKGLGHASQSSCTAASELFGDVGLKGFNGVLLKLLARFLRHGA
jgi:hypothetical protein